MAAARRGRLLLATLLAVLTAGACQVEPERATRVLLEATEMYISDLEWLADGSIWLLRGYGSDGPDELVRATTDGRSAVVPIRSAVDCPDPELIDLAALPDGRLGAVEACEGLTRARTAVALDGDRPVRLARLGDQDGAVLWDAGLRSGWVRSWSPGCASVGRLVGGAVVPFPSLRSADPLPWDGGLPEYRRCPPSGQIGVIASSPTGDLCFLATGHRKDDSGGAEVWRLYCLRVASGELRRIGPELTEPWDLAVRPDGRQALVSGRRNDRPGLWRIDLTSGKTSLVVRGRFDRIAPAPDGHQVALVRPGPGAGDEVVEVTLE